MIERRSSSAMMPRAISTVARSCCRAATYARRLPWKCKEMTAFSAFSTAFVVTRAYKLATAREYAAVNAGCGSWVMREIDAATSQRTGWPETVQREPRGKISWPDVRFVFKDGPTIRGALQSLGSRVQR